VYGKNPTDSYYVLEGGGGGTVIPGNLGVTGNLDVSGTITGGSNLTLGPSATPTIQLLSTAPGPRTEFGQNSSVGSIVAKDSAGTIRGPQVLFDALNYRNRWTTGDGTAPLLDISSPAPGSTGVVNSFATTTVGRPTGDVAVDALLKVQNGGGYGIAFRSNAGDVTAGGTIERVSAGVPSDVPDITITSTGAVTFAQSTTVATGARANAPLFNLVGGAGVSNYGIINCAGGGAATPVANTAITATSIVHLTPVTAAALTAPVSYVQNAGVGFTIYNSNVGAFDVAYSVHSLQAGI